MDDEELTSRHQVAPSRSCDAEGGCSQWLDYVLPGLGILLALIGSSLLVAFGYLYIKPFLKVRHLLAGTCVTSSSRLDAPVRCSCSKEDAYDCLSLYPCLHVWVNLTTQTGDVTENVTLYDSWPTYELHLNAHQCSYHKCHSSSRENQRAVIRFAERFGSTGATYPCHYAPAPAALNATVLHVVATSDVINAVLWPSLAILTGSALFAINLLTGGLCCRHRAPPTNHRPEDSPRSIYYQTKNRYDKIKTNTNLSTASYNG